MKKFMMVVMSCILLLTNSVYAVVLTDVQDHWAKETIGYLVESGIVNGYDDGTFKPEDTVQVDAFIKMVVTSLGHTLENGSSYWASTFINKAKELGLVKEGEFDTYESPINRAEMARMIVRALQEEYPDNLDEYKALITDYDTIADPYKAYIVKAYTKGIITGYEDGSFKPEQNATRAEAATMIVRMLDAEQRKVPELPAKDNVLMVNDKEITTEVPEVVEVYNKLVELYSTTGEKHTVFAELSNEISIFPDDSIPWQPKMYRVNCYLAKDDIAQYYLGLRAYDEKTLHSFKQTLKVFFPTQYEEVFKKMMEEHQAKREWGVTKGQADQRSYTIGYDELSDNVYMYVTVKR